MGWESSNPILRNSHAYDVGYRALFALLLLVEIAVATFTNSHRKELTGDERKAFAAEVGDAPPSVAGELERGGIP